MAMLNNQMVNESKTKRTGDILRHYWLKKSRGSPSKPSARGLCLVLSSLSFPATTLQRCKVVKHFTLEQVRQWDNIDVNFSVEAPKPEIFMGDEFPSSQGLCAELEWDYEDPFGGSRFSFIVGMPIQSYTNILLSQLSQA